MKPFARKPSQIASSARTTPRTAPYCIRNLIVSILTHSASLGNTLISLQKNRFSIFSMSCHEHPLTLQAHELSGSKIRHDHYLAINHLFRLVRFSDTGNDLTLTDVRTDIHPKTNELLRTFDPFRFTDGRDP